MKIRIAACLLVVCSIVSCSRSDETSNQRLKELSDQVGNLRSETINQQFKELSGQIENLRREIESINARLKEAGHDVMTVKARLQESDAKQKRFSEQLATRRHANDGLTVKDANGVVRVRINERGIVLVDGSGKHVASLTHDENIKHTMFRIGGSNRPKYEVLSTPEEISANWLSKHGRNMAQVIHNTSIHATYLFVGSFDEPRFFASSSPDRLTTTWTVPTTDPNRSRNLVQIGLGKWGGGNIDIFNRFNKGVVTAQSKENNGGVVFVSNSRGVGKQPSNFLNSSP